jgi:hypothetical protein
MSAHDPFEFPKPAAVAVKSWALWPVGNTAEKAGFRHI